MVKCRVLLLDSTEFTCDIQKSSKGQDLFDKVCQHLSLTEKDYFSCSFKDDKKNRFWLNNDKKISKQISGNCWSVAFEVKFYPSDPCVLKEEQSRYQLFLQLRQDIMTGILPCSFLTHALLGSYAIQSLFGDYDVREHGIGTQYFAHIQFAPQQSDELLEKIAELHRGNRGMAPADAELHYLQNAKNIALYGVHLHVAKDSDGCDVEIGVCATGLMVYRNHLRVHRFMWPKIIKFSYKWNTFSLRIRPSDNDKTPTFLEYKLTNDKMAKRLWKIAVEHHTFFRLREPDIPTNDMMSHFAPKYRYSGRTQYQVQLASSLSMSGTLNRGTLDRSTTASLASSRRYGGGSKSLENVIAGYSTERSELYTPESKHVATLDLKHRRANAGSTSPSVLDTSRVYSTLDSSRNPHDMSSTIYPLTVMPPGGDHSQLLMSSSPRPAGSPNSYDNRSGLYGTDVDGHLLEGYSRTPNYGTGFQPNRSVVGNDRLPSSQDDHLTERGYRQGVAGQASWNQSGTMPGGAYQSSSRTYNTQDGSVRTNVDQRYVMYSTWQAPSAGGMNGHYSQDEMDHDKALTEAILAVTAMNTDLSVEKIEITHNRTM